MTIEYGYKTTTKDWLVIVKDESGHIIDSSFEYDWDAVQFRIGEFKDQYGDCEVIKREDF